MPQNSISTPPGAGLAAPPSSPAPLTALDDLAREMALAPAHSSAARERIETICERVRATLAADLVTLIEPFQAGGQAGWSRFLLATGPGTAMFEGVFSRYADPGTGAVPGLLLSNGFVAGLSAPVDDENEPDCRRLGVYWRARGAQAREADRFLDTAARLLHAEIRRQEVDGMRERLAERLCREQRESAEAAAALEERVRAESLFRAIGTTLPFGVWVTDAEGRPNYVSQSFLNMIGMDIADYRAFLWRRLLHPDDRDRVVEEWFECVRKRDFWDREYRIFGQDGTLYTVLSRGAPFHDDGGRIIGWSGMTIDISDRRDSRDRLRRSEELYRGVVTLANEGIWRLDPNGRTRLSNRRVSEMLGIPDADLRSEPIFSFVSPECRAGFLERWRDLLLGEGQKFDCCFRGTDGRETWAQVSASSLKGGDGAPDGALILLTDISSRREAEAYLLRAKQEAESANEAKSRFLANMSHEIRTPLGAVVGFAELLLDEDQTEQQRLDCVNAIRRNGRLLLELINDILDLSKVEAGKMEMETKPFSLLDLVIELRTLFKPQALKRGLRYDVDAAPDLPRWISTDPTRLRQILINLIGNAMKFTERGSVRVSLLREGDQFICRVADSGIGIRPECVTKLFTPFVQADSTVTRQFGGTGLGLVLARNLARALGGDVRLVQSEPDRGSTFECRVRFHAAPNVPAARPRLSGNGAHARSERPLEHVEILAADDSEDNRLLLRRLLQKCGARVTLTENGRQAAEHALSGRFDIVLMDIQMPEMDGYEATRFLRSKGYRGPIIALTAHALKEEKDLILGAGCDRHVTKPVDRDDLVATIQDALRESLEIH